MAALLNYNYLQLYTENTKKDRGFDMNPLSFLVCGISEALYGEVDASNLLISETSKRYTVFFSRLTAK